MNRLPPMLQDYQRGIIDFAPPDVDAAEYFAEKNRQQCAHLATPQTIPEPQPLDSLESKSLDSQESRLESEAARKLQQIAKILKIESARIELDDNPFLRLPNNPKTGFKFHNQIMWKWEPVTTVKEGIYSIFESQPKLRLLQPENRASPLNDDKQLKSIPPM